MLTLHRGPVCGHAYAGTVTTRSGAYSSSGVIRGTLTTTPVAVCGTGNLSHVGTYRVKARVYPVMGTATASDLQVRLSYREGDGPLRSNAWTYPVAGTAAFSEVDLGLISIPEATLGTQRWTGQIEAYSSTAGDTLDVDYITLIPAGEGYGRARAPFQFETVTAFAARDEFDQASGDLHGKTLPVGGTWATSGATTSFAVDSGTHTVTRSTASDLPFGRFAIASLAASAAQLVQVDVAIAGGVVLRYVDGSNFVIAFLRDNGQLYVIKDVAGSNTVTTFTTPYDPSTGWYTIRGVALADGTLAIWVFPQNGTPGNPYVSNVAEMATGGVLASGKVGIVDYNIGSTAATRSFDNFAAAIPTPDAVVFSGQSAEIRHDSAIREDATGTYYGPVNSYRGSRFYLPPAGSEGRTTQVLVKLRRNDLDVAADDHIADATTVSVSYRPRFIAVPR